jgi:hypothetical protein
MARTAVVAGTATVVSNKVSHGMNEKAEAKQQAQMEAEQAQAAQMQAAAEQAVAQAQAAQPAAPAAAAAGASDDVIEKLTKLGELKAAGVLTDEEFAAQKAKLLGA